MLFLDGVYVVDGGHPVFRHLRSPDTRALEGLIQTICHRVGAYLERRGLLVRDIENTYLALESTEASAMDDLLGHSISCRPVLASTKPSIAVLNFSNLSDDPNQQYFSDGMTSNICSRLSHIRSLKVKSGVEYDLGKTPLPQISRELGVSYLLGGSVQRERDRVRVFVELTDGSSGEIIGQKILIDVVKTLLIFRTKSREQLQGHFGASGKQYVRPSTTSLRKNQPQTSTLSITYLKASITRSDIAHKSLYWLMIVSIRLLSSTPIAPKPMVGAPGCTCWRSYWEAPTTVPSH